MPKTSTKTTVLANLRDSMAADALSEEISEEQIARALREAGGDPAGIRKRGASLAAALLEDRRLAWREAARRKIDLARSLMAPTAPPRTREGLLEAISARRAAFQQRGLTLGAAFRNRRPEESSDDELTEILAELEILDRLDSDDGSSEPR